jgi:hypothetical protein
MGNAHGSSSRRPYRITEGYNVGLDDWQDGAPGSKPQAEPEAWARQGVRFLIFRHGASRAFD